MGGEKASLRATIVARASGVAKVLRTRATDVARVFDVYKL